MAVTFPYPPVLSPREHARRVPGHIMGGFVGRWVEILLEPLARIDAEAADYAWKMVHRTSADGAALAAHGSWVGEAQGGLTEQEYRRIVLGALAAVSARRAWRWDTARAMILALTGVADEDLTLEVLAGCEVRAFATVRYHPTDGFVRRIEGVVSRAVPPGWYFSIHMVPEGALIADGTPGADVGFASWYVSGTGGT